MQAFYPSRLFAVPIEFESHHSLETCKERLMDIEVRPAGLQNFLGASYLNVALLPFDADLCEFQAHRRTGRTTVEAKGHLQKIGPDLTSINGYSNANFTFYVFLFLIMAIGFFIAIQIYSGNRDTALVSGAIVIMFLVSTIANLLIVRNKARVLASIIEAALKD